MPTGQLNAIFGALADPTRRAILARLTEGDATVGQLSAPFDVSQPAISRHLKVLEHALHPWVAFGIVPIFAFANAGVNLEGLSLRDLLQPISQRRILARGVRLGRRQVIGEQVAHRRPH